MKALPVTIRRIGNSLGVVIPKPILAQVGLAGQAEMSVEHDAVVLRKPSNRSRAGWSAAARSVAAQSGDKLLMGEFSNQGDADLSW